MKNMLDRFRFIPSLLLLVLITQLCNCDKPCPEIEQPEIVELTKWQKERFPYSKYYKLVFRIEEPGRIDTVTLYRDSYDSTTVNYGDDFNKDDGCPKAYTDRFIRYEAKFSIEGNEKIAFRNSADRPEITAHWSQDYSGTGHWALDSFYGTKNIAMTLSI
ncbi:MAG: hypothetical protein KDC92_04100 [Bacteroidetes bacterium]|nr:hypothetical protein [Bacteroidota bacterium]